MARLSMNSSLRDAHIFEDDSWDEVSAGLSEKPVLTPTTFNKEAKTEFGFTFTATTPIKEEPRIKEEPKIKTELLDEDSNFPIDKEALAKFCIKSEFLTSPMKTEGPFSGPFDENTASSMDSNSKRSFKSARISQYKTRESPYKKPIYERLGTKESPKKLDSTKQILSLDERPLANKRKLKRSETETDPLVLSRRQKQIDYGKNTMGYDLYTKKVQRNRRQVDDPQTPNKYVKYSRRGWDGLIKQWRLKLHKYDPIDD